MFTSMSVIEPAQAETLRDRVDKLRRIVEIMPRGHALMKLLGVAPETLASLSPPEPSVPETDRPQQADVSPFDQEI